MKKRNILKAGLLTLLFGSVVGCSNNLIEINSLSDLQNYDVNIGVPSDYDVEAELNALCKSCTISYYDDVNAGIDAVKSGKIHGYALGEQVFEQMELEGSLDGIKLLEEPLKVYGIGLGLCESCPISNYKTKVDQFITTIKENGVLADMNRRWIVDNDFNMPDIQLPSNPTYTLKAVTFGGSKPYSFLKDNKLAGFDVELVYRLASFLDCGLNLELAEYPAMLMGLASGKYDVISANLYITSEREENITYSEPYSNINILLGVKDFNYTSSDETLWESIQSGFYKTFIQENRWLSILSGFGTTLIITLFAFLLGNILGGVFCYFSMSKSKILHVLYEIYSRIMQGVPIVVILMLLYYIVFGKSSISGVYVAILGFGLTTGSSLAIQFKGALASVPKEQKEAGLALGLTPFQTFKGIIFPQAARNILPGYFAEIIGLLKATSIVGYIAVTDLTKVGDLIRSATFEAYFPLFSVALIYFLTSFLLISLMNLIQKKFFARKQPADDKGGM